MNKSISYIILLIAFPFYFTGCKKEVRPTSMTIKDSHQISEIQPSCGCIILDKSSHIIIPEDGIRQFKATYNSIKNVGEVVHRIRIFGNMLPHGKAELKFDVNVVPDADYTRDYEELYQDFNTKNGIVREMVDGKESELGYYVGEP